MKSQASLLQFRVEIGAYMCMGNKTKGRPSSSSLKTKCQLKKKMTNSAALQIQDVRRHEIEHCPVLVPR
jgi:hypothetical protein